MRKKDFNNVFRKGRARVGRLVFLKFLKNDLNNSRFGFVVSTKISRKAVVRNKIKRRLREIVRQSNIEPGFDVVIIAKPEITDSNYQDIKNELKNLFKIL